MIERQEKKRQKIRMKDILRDVDEKSVPREFVSHSKTDSR